MSGCSLQWGRAAAFAFSPSRMAQERPSGRKISWAKDEPDKRLSDHSGPAREAYGWLSVYLSITPIC